MYVGVGRRMRHPSPHPSNATIGPHAAAAAVQASCIVLTNPLRTRRLLELRLLRPQCSYDNYVYAPQIRTTRRTPRDSGVALHDVVYLSGVNQYNENNTGTGRSNGRAVLLSTDAGATFTDMTEDDRSSSHPGALHPDHHALVVNPLNWQQFFDIGDGGVNRSDGVFVNDAADCVTPPHSFVVPSRIAFCRSSCRGCPGALTAINTGLRTLHIYTLDYDRNNPERIAAGTQDNGSWETMGDRDNWLNINIADGGPNRYDATGSDSEFALTAFQSGSLMVRYNPMQQVDANWISTRCPIQLGAAVRPGGIGVHRAGGDRSGLAGLDVDGPRARVPVEELRPQPHPRTKDAHRANCNIWTGAFGDLNGNGSTISPATGVTTGSRSATRHRQTSQR